MTDETTPVEASSGTTGAIRLSGSVEAVRSQAVVVPRMAGATLTPLVITRLIPSGTRVEAGDVLVEFDRQEQERTALDRRATVVDLDGQLAKKKADQAVAEARDDTELKQAENDVERARLDVRKNIMLARSEAEKNTLALEQAEARLAQLRTTYDLKRRAAEADLQILQIRRDREANAMERALQNASLMQIRAPYAGLVVVRTIYRSNAYVEIQEGDEVRPGYPVLNIVDTSSMVVRARVNQADGGLVREGLPARIQLDGFPDLQFDGRVEDVTPIGITSEMTPRVRSFTALVSIAGTHAQLLPDLTASVEILPDAAPAPPGSSP
ncbi:MAG TPA: efflux RND transporter periplasmic adaptor subunit [Vicinamibacterales bacterium]|nr:efflux RND transporter periplasmic adaptor subunit [Vicinamibacterales bacterium]